MSVDETKLLFEGFLQKRKDTLKIRWATYWFRLQNATLFFYTKKNGSASHLRGYYYIYTVQSVREVQRADSKRFMFEIIMKNGKIKMLAADTAALRKEWVGHLWQAMRISTSRVSVSSVTCLEECEQRDRLNSSESICSQSSDSAVKTLPYPVPFPVCLSQEVSSEEPTYPTLSACSCQDENGDSLNSPQWSSGFKSEEDRQEGDYDVLPLRNKLWQSNVSTEIDEGVYDTPLSYRSITDNQEATESIYDVPGSLLRKTSDRTTDEEPEEGVF